MSSPNRISVTNPTQPVISVTDEGGVLITVNYQNSTGGGGSGDVVGPSSSTDNAIVRYDGTTGKLIQNSGITIADGASGTLSGTNSGDVTLGTANGLSLAGQALSLAAASGSTTGALTSSDWTTFNSKQAAGNYITALTGDVTASGPGSAVAALANTAVTPGSYTLASITVDAKGRVTAASSGASTSPGGSNTQVQFNNSGAFGGDADFTFDTATNKVGLTNIQAIGSGGINLYASTGTSIGNLGPAGTANVSWDGSHNFSAATQDTIAAFVGTGKTLSSLATATYPSLTELSYVKGVTSAIQTQIDGRVLRSGDTMTGTLNGTSIAMTAAVNTTALSGTISLTGSGTAAALDLTATWNTSGNAILIRGNLTNTASGTSSRLVDLLVGGTSRYAIDSSTNAVVTVGGQQMISHNFGGNGRMRLCSTLGAFINPGVEFTVSNNSRIGWASQPGATVSDTGLARVAAGIVAQVNGVNAQSFRVNNTFTSATNLEALVLDWQTTANTAFIGTVKGSGGGSARALNLGTDSTNRMGFEPTTFNMFMLASSGSYGSGSGVLFLGNATTVPTTDPTGGGVLYVEAGAIKWRGSSGTVTTIAPA